MITIQEAPCKPQMPVTHCKSKPPPQSIDRDAHLGAILTQVLAPALSGVVYIPALSALSSSMHFLQRACAITCHVAVLHSFRYPLCEQSCAQLAQAWWEPRRLSWLVHFLLQPPAHLPALPSASEWCKTLPASCTCEALCHCSKLNSW